MKCQKCDKPATFHITELEGGKHHELHFCEECARIYLTQGSVEPNVPATMAGALAQQLAVGQTAEDLARLDQKACPVCGITFFEFRNHGRLGCPHDYIFFEKDLDPLILNIHGETAHTGKRPPRLAEGTQRRTELIKMRRDMKDAIKQEDYEKASGIRDEIRRIEDTGSAS
ncbi:MAG: UvrB/UvrC motif-containing protein [Planctomycetota bacterium]|nr:UvrB/UvrC motif-containing protein [Planctomycetota bacterium]